MPGGFMQGRGDVAFVTAGSFADNVSAGLSGQEFKQPAMRFFNRKIESGDC